LTHDVDIVVALEMTDVPAFVAAFPLEDFYCPHAAASAATAT
jgi:hypothetical protein